MLLGKVILETLNIPLPSMTIVMQVGSVEKPNQRMIENLIICDVCREKWASQVA